MKIKPYMEIKRNNLVLIYNFHIKNSQNDRLDLLHSRRRLTTNKSKRTSVICIVASLCRVTSLVGGARRRRARRQRGRRHAPTLARPPSGESVNYTCTSFNLQTNSCI